MAAVSKAHNIPFLISTDHSTYDVEKRDRTPDLGPLQLVGEEDDVFLYKSKSQTTEDLFTIIHR